MAVAIKDYVAKLCPEMMPLQEDGDELCWLDLRLHRSVNFWIDEYALTMTIHNNGCFDDHRYPTDAAIQQAARWLMGKNPEDKPPESPHKSACAPPADSPRTDR